MLTHFQARRGRAALCILFVTPLALFLILPSQEPRLAPKVTTEARLPPPSPHPPTEQPPSLGNKDREYEDGGSEQLFELAGAVLNLAAASEEGEDGGGSRDEGERGVGESAKEPLSAVCQKNCSSWTCGELAATADLTCSGFLTLGCDCSGCCAPEPPSPPQPPPQPPPPALACGLPCGSWTCGQLDAATASFTCDAAVQLGCDCGDCCLPVPCKSRTVRNVFEGTGLGESGEEEIMGLEFDNKFTTTFYNMTCLLHGGTGDPCDAHVGEACALCQFRTRPPSRPASVLSLSGSDADEMFSGLTILFILSTIVSVVALYAFAQPGGIPRPSTDKVDKEGTEYGEVEIRGALFYFAWMIAQARA